MCRVGAGGCVQEHACSHPYISHADSASLKSTAGEAEGRCGAASEGDQSQLTIHLEAERAGTVRAKSTGHHLYVAHPCS